jgi:tRNA pseudouridine32 synthase/23S rRNA pseudouridine746 synthase
LKNNALKLPPLHYNPPNDPLNILYQDDDLLVLSKPSGLLSVPGKPLDHRDCLETRAKAAIPNALLTHRLDMETSGVFMMALNKDAQVHINRQFEHRKTEKHYIAQVWGHVQEDNGIIDQPLICDWENRPRQKICYAHGRPAQTEWTVLNRGELSCGNAFTRMLLKPITGRSHQLRVHMEYLEHPILGEVFYAHDDAEHAADRLQLHAESLTIYHPTKKELVTFTDPAPF